MRRHIGNVSLGKRPRVVYAVAGPSRAVRRLGRRGVDVLEWRIDWMAREPTARRLIHDANALRRAGLPLIATVRRADEGGRAQWSDTRRLRLYTLLAPLVDALDVELRSTALLEDVGRLARAWHKTLILSFHDFAATPSIARLDQTIRQARRHGADVVKVATLARSADDVLRLLRLTLRHRTAPLVTIALGPRGAISRILFPLLGSVLTYTSLSPSHGQLPLKQLVDGLRRSAPQRLSSVVRSR